ncbi:hypothetical protein FB451DRAFT_1404907 [Mycena latifolia]|nr:hypothetical protein FB451DRAFT_1404907 [Mycena latifolia]
MSCRSASRSTPNSTITLYDSPGTGSQTWVPNIWRIRFILNYKRLPYRTVCGFPDVETTLRSIGAPPSSRRADGRPVYTLLVIVDLTRNAQAPPKSFLIRTTSRSTSTGATPRAHVCEAIAPHHAPHNARPTPGAHPVAFSRHLALAQTPARVVPPAPPGPQREHAWQLVKEQFDFLAVILDKNVGDGDGVVAQDHHHVSYAGFALCLVLLWTEQMAPHDGWARVREWNGGRWARLRQRCQDYMDVF